jgi:molybdenum cofactor biosynthesis enzyme MoaA
MDDKQFCKPIVLYGCGSDAGSALSLLKKQGYNPLCFCDSDSSKHGKVVFGLTVESIENILHRYENIIVFVTPKSSSKFEIIDSLLKLGISKEQILNYEKREYVRSCSDLAYVLLIGQYEYFYCCSLGNRRPPPPSIKSCGNIRKDVKNILEKKNMLLSCLKNQANNSGCEGCPSLKKGWYPSKPKINTVAFSIYYPCNLRCSYCDVWRIYATLTPEQKEWQDNFKLDLFLRELGSWGGLAEDCKLEISAGEITINPRFAEIIDTVHDLGLSGIVFSNCVVYNERLADLIASAKWFLLESLDAGTRSTFVKIKGRDVFMDVIENIRRYAASGGNIELKYIVTDKNSNDNDLSGFLNLCDEIKPRKIRLSCDLHNDFNNLSNRIIDFVINLGRESIKRGHEITLLEHFGVEKHEYIRSQIFNK